MTGILIFTHDGWTVTTSAWTVASKKAAAISLCYSWSSISGLGFFDSATGVQRVELAMSMSEFLSRVFRGGVIDLRDVGPA